MKSTLGANAGRLAWSAGIAGKEIKPLYFLRSIHNLHLLS